MATSWKAPSRSPSRGTAADVEFADQGNADVHSAVVIRQPLTQLRHHRGAAFLVTLALASVLLAGATVPHSHLTGPPASTTRNTTSATWPLWAASPRWFRLLAQWCRLWSSPRRSGRGTGAGCRARSPPGSPRPAPPLASAPRHAARPELLGGAAFTNALPTAEDHHVRNDHYVAIPGSRGSAGDRGRRRRRDSQARTREPCVSSSNVFQQEYAKAVEAVSERLQRLEAQSATAAASPLTAQAPPAPPRPTTHRTGAATVPAQSDGPGAPAPAVLAGRAHRTRTAAVRHRRGRRLRRQLHAEQRGQGQRRHLPGRENRLLSRARSSCRSSARSIPTPAARSSSRRPRSSRTTRAIST